MELTKIDWKPRQANKGISKVIFGVTIILNTDKTFFQTFTFSLAMGFAFGAGFKPNRMTEPKILTARDDCKRVHEIVPPRIIKRIDVDPFQPWLLVVVSIPRLFSKKYAQQLPKTYP